MSIYYTVYSSKPTNPVPVEKLEEIIPGCEITVSETIVKISGIYGNKFDEIAKCFPFNSAKSYNSEKEDYALTKEEKEIVTALFAESDFIIVRNDCLFSVDLFTGNDDNNDGICFEDYNFLFWNDLTNIVKEEIKSHFEDANVDFEEFLKIF